MTNPNCEFRGFSSIELICSLSLISLVLYIGLLNFSEFRRSFNQNAAYTQLQFDLRRAKTEARQRGALVYVSQSAGSNSYSVGVDYLPYNSDGTFDEKIFSRQLPSGFTTEFSSDLIFDSRGAVKDEWGNYGSVSISLTNELGNQFAWGSVYGAGMIDLYGYHS